MKGTAGAWLMFAMALFVPSACIPSNVVARDDRMVTTSVQDLKFAPLSADALRLQLVGLFESVEITGDAALALRKVYYLFAADGSYTAAALVEEGAQAAFQTLTGTWQVVGDGLVLDGGEPVPVQGSEDGQHLRIQANTGGLVLRRGMLL